MPLGSTNAGAIATPMGGEIPEGNGETARGAQTDAVRQPRQPASKWPTSAPSSRRSTAPADNFPVDGAPQPGNDRAIQRARSYGLCRQRALLVRFLPAFELAAPPVGRTL
jgi:hypothetical protein